MSKIHRPGRVAAMTAVSALLAAAGAGALDAAGPDAAASLARAVPAAATCTSGLIGDVTGDNAVNIIDAQQIARAAAGLTVSGTVQDRLLSHGDVTDDGNTNIIDAQQIARWAAGLSTSFPIGQACSADGILTAQNNTSGSNLPSSFGLTLDGSTNLEMPANGSVDAPLDLGSHELVLTLPANCTTGSPLTQTTTTTSEFPNWSVNWVIECS